MTGGNGDVDLMTLLIPAKLRRNNEVCVKRHQSGKLIRDRLH